MYRKTTFVLAASAFAYAGLVTIVSASIGDSFDITGNGRTARATPVNPGPVNLDPDTPRHTALPARQPVKLDIGTGDDGDKPTAPLADDDGGDTEQAAAGPVRFQPAVGPERTRPRLNIGAGDDNDKPTGPPSEE